MSLVARLLHDEAQLVDIGYDEDTTVLTLDKAVLFEVTQFPHDRFARRPDARSEIGARGLRIDHSPPLFRHDLVRHEEDLVHDALAHGLRDGDDQSLGEVAHLADQELQDIFYNGPVTADQFPEHVLRHRGDGARRNGLDAGGPQLAVDGGPESKHVAFVDVPEFHLLATA